MIVVGVVLAASGLLAAIFVPVHSSSQLLQVSDGTTASASVTVPQAAWVTVHFSHPFGAAMMYGMDGPSGMMFSHREAAGGDSYSFGTWGGTFRCWAEPAGPGMAGSVPVWVNATWGLL